MSFQAYIDNAEAKTGKKLSFFAEEAAKKGFTKSGQIVAWLKSEYELGHGHANAVAHAILNPQGNTKTEDERVSGIFNGAKSVWRSAYDELVSKLGAFGSDFKVDPTKSYISLLKGDKKFGILQPSTKDRFDVGIKLKGVLPEGRLEEAGAWNAMVTHRVRISAPGDIDSEVLRWLKQAYETV